MKKRILSFLIIIVLSLLLIACNDNTLNGDNDDNGDNHQLTYDETANYDIYYQIFIRSFADSNGDGIGDINGITENLDYIENLGVTAIWMLPFHETDDDWSSYHGYRIKDYYSINSEYGTMADLEKLIEEASKRDIKVMMDLVVNHTSDTNPWYVNKNTNGKSDWYTGYRSFPGGMVDLNKNNSEVVSEIKNIIKFYMEKGIKGFRFDAVKHLYDFDANANNLASQLFLNDLRSFAREIDPNVLFLGEVFDYNYDNYYSYYLGLDSVFDFYTAAKIWEKVGHTEGVNLFSDISRAYAKYQQYNPNYIPALFISNHDIDRIASFGQFNNQRLKQAAAVILTLPGTPHIYYGEEIGMKGTDNQSGKYVSGQGEIYDHYRRSPFLWGDENKQTTWLNPLADSHSTPTVSQSLTDTNSLLNHYKKLIEVRKANPALMYGNKFEIWTGTTRELQGIVREYVSDDVSQKVLIVHNISANSNIINVEYEKVIYGTLEIPAYGTVILEIK